MRHHRSGGGTVHLAVAAAVLVVGVGRPAPEPTPAAAGTPPVVEVVEVVELGTVPDGGGAPTVRFTEAGASAGRVEVALGGTVVWRNDGAVVHGLASPDGAVDALPSCQPPEPQGCLAPGEAVAVTFHAAGRFELTSTAVQEQVRDRYNTTVLVAGPPTSSAPTEPVPPSDGAGPEQPSTTTAPAATSTTGVPGGSTPPTASTQPGGPDLTPLHGTTTTTTAAPTTTTAGQAEDPSTATSTAVPAPSGSTSTTSAAPSGSTSTTVAGPTTTTTTTVAGPTTTTTAGPCAVGDPAATSTTVPGADPAVTATTSATDPCPTVTTTTVTTDRCPTGPTTPGTPADTEPDGDGTATTSTTGPAPAGTAATTTTVEERGAAPTAGPATTAEGTTTTTTTCEPATTTTTTGTGPTAPCPDDVAPTTTTSSTTPVQTVTSSTTVASTGASTTTAPTGPCTPPGSTTTVPGDGGDGGDGPEPVGAEVEPSTTTSVPMATSTTTSPLTPAAPPPPPSSPPPSSPSPWASPPGPSAGPGGFPAELRALSDSVVRTGPRTTSALVGAAAMLESAGFTPGEAVRAAFGRFPVGGPARYGHDWWFPRFGPGWRLHQGTDIFARHGTPVRAPAAGVATTARGGLGGLSVRVTEEDGTYWYLAHLSAFAAGLQDGTRVEVGDVVGYVGDTGNAAGTPPHLHIELHPGGGDAVDPKPVLDAMLDEAEALATVAADRAAPHLGPAQADQAPGPSPVERAAEPSAEAGTVVRLDLQPGADAALWSPGDGPAWMAAAWVRPPWPGSTAPAPASSDDPVVVAASLAAITAALGLGVPRPRSGRRRGTRRRGDHPAVVSAPTASVGGRPARRG